MKCKVLLLLVMSISCLMSYAQTEDVAAATKKINAIKKDSKYLYAESTTSNWEQAYENAKALLDTEIEGWVYEQSKKEQNKQTSVTKGYVARINNQVMEVKTRRGKLFRVFVYIQKSNILTYTENDDFLVTKMDSVGEVSKKTVSSVSTVLESMVEPVKQFSYALTEQDKTFLSLTQPQDIESFLKTHTDQYGKLSALPEQQDYYIIVFAKQSIVAHLKKTALEGVETSNNHFPVVNLNSLSVDNLNDYKEKGWGAIWFVMK